MLRFIAPDLRLENVRQLSLDRLRRLGLDALLLDVDCTLKEYRAEEVTPEVAAWLEREVISQLDHRNLNVEVPFLDGVIPTAENIARILAQIVRDGPHGEHLYEVRLFESENNAARVLAEDL